MARTPVWRDLGYTEMEWKALPPEKKKKEKARMALRYVAFITVPIVVVFFLIGFFALLTYLQYLTFGG